LGRSNVLSAAIALKATLGPDEALNGPGEQEKIGLTIGHKVGDNLSGGTKTHWSLSQAYQRSSGCLLSPASTLNLVLTVSAMPQQNSDLGSMLR
jgi:hypothetical protein